MNRYTFAQEDKRWDGKRVYKSLLYPVIPVAYNDIYVITNEVSTFDALANKYYKDSTLWWIISMANNNITKGALYPAPGTQLRIPTDITAVIRQFNQFNKVR